MVLDSFNNAAKYYGLGEEFRKGLEYLAQTDLDSLPDGKVDIDGDKMYCMVMGYQSKEPSDCLWEAHRSYVDIQCITTGVEHIEVGNTDGLTSSESYNPEIDRERFTGSGDFVTLKPGYFAIFFTHDAHRPCLRVDGSVPVRKFCLKLAAG